MDAETIVSICFEIDVANKPQIYNSTKVLLLRNFNSTICSGGM